MPLLRIWEKRDSNIIASKRFDLFPAHTFVSRFNSGRLHIHLTHMPQLIQKKAPFSTAAESVLHLIEWRHQEGLTLQTLTLLEGPH